MRGRCNKVFLPFTWGGGPHSTLDSVLASYPAAPGSNPGVPKIFPRNISFPRKNC